MTFVWLQNEFGYEARIAHNWTVTVTDNHIREPFAWVVDGPPLLFWHKLRARTELAAMAEAEPIVREIFKRHGQRLAGRKRRAKVA